MKIDRIEPILIAAKSRNWVIVKIGTDDGVTGIGEATLEGRSATVATAVSEMARYLVGKNPFHIERHYQHIDRGQFWKGGPVLMSVELLVDMHGRTNPAEAIALAREYEKIAATAEAYYVLVSPHNPNSPVSTAADNSDRGAVAALNEYCFRPIHERLRELQRNQERHQ